MRDFKGMKRQRGRNRGGGQGGGKPQQNINRAFDSNGPDNVKVRGHAQHVYEKYSALARDASSGGDPVLAENYLQHAEHYFRTLRAIQPNRPASEIAARDTFTAGIDIDFEDEALETAMEAADAAAAERGLNGGAPQGAEATPVEGEGDPQPRQDRNDNRREGWRNERNGPDRNGGDRSGGDRNGGDRNFADRSDRDFRQGRQNGQGGDRQNGEIRRDRDDRPREERYEGRRDRQDRWGAERNGAGEATGPRGDDSAQQPDAPTPAEAPPGVMLRSRDGEESHAPAFLGTATAAPTPADDGDAEARRPRRPRRPRRDAEAGAAAPEPEEA